MYVTLSEAKKQIQIDEWFNDDDNYIKSLIDVAEDIVSKELGKPLKECIDKNGGINPSAKHSILVMIGTLYSQREATSNTTISKVPYTYDYLTSLNKRFFI